METFTGIRAFVDHPDYRTHRQAALNSLDMETIDAPIVPIIEGMATLPYCFTLQSCYGHFLYGDQREPRNVERLPALIHVSDIRVVAQQDLWGIHARNGHFPLEPPCFLVDLAALWGIMPVKRNQSLILQQLY